MVRLPGSMEDCLEVFLKRFNHSEYGKIYNPLPPSLFPSLSRSRGPIIYSLGAKFGSRRTFVLGNRKGIVLPNLLNYIQGALPLWYEIFTLV